MTQISRSRSRLFFHSARVLYSRRSGNPNPKRPGAAPRKANRRISSGGTAFASDERTRMLGVSASAKSATSLVGSNRTANTGRNTMRTLHTFYIHHPASTVAHRSAIDTPPREADAVIIRRGNYVRAHLCAPYLSGWHQLLCRILSLTCLPPGRWPSSCRLAARTSNTAGRLCPSVCAQDGDRGTR